MNLSMRYFCRSTLVVLIAAIFLDGPHGQSFAAEQAFIPLKVDLEALATPEGLELSDVKEEIVSFTFADGTTRDIRKRTFHFFSQRFLDEDWYHDAYLFEPVDLDPDDHDKAILLSHVYNNKIFDDMLDRYGLRTAAVVGVPMLIFKPNPVNKEFFKNHPEIRRSESQWQEFTFQKFRETGDINVTSFAVIMKAKWRAIAAMEAVLGRKLEKLIYCGGSKGGASVRAMFKEDPRIVSVVCSGSIPFATNEYIEANSEPYIQHFVEEFYLRPNDFENSTIFFNLGSNDYNAPPKNVTETYYRLKGDRRLYTHPNGGHPAIADEQVKAMQLWCAHVFHGVAIPEVLPPKVTRRDDRLVFRTRIMEGEQVESADLSYACFDLNAGEFTPGRRNPKPQWPKAKWTTVSMAKENGKYVASLPGDVCEDLAQLNVTVRAKVVAGRVVGYVSSPVHDQESYARYKAGQKKSRKKPAKADYNSPLIHDDGRVTFALTAPDAAEVNLVGRFSASVDSIGMSKDEHGVWRKTLAGLTGGIYNYGFSIDGSTLIADPLNPKVYRRNIEPTVWSFLEMPGAEGPMFYEERDVPHGVVHSHAYRSQMALQTRRLLVYTPPGYLTTPDRHYPVLYLLHGGGDMADGFLTAGRIDVILDNLIADKRAKPMIVVMPRSNGRSAYKRLPDGHLDRSKNFHEFEQMFFAEIAPYVEERYRISERREDHAVAGFSVGAALARTVGLKHLDFFAWVGQFSGGSRLGDDYEETFAPIFKDIEKTNNLLKLYWVSGPTGENSLPPFHQRLADAGIRFVSRSDRFGHSYRTCRHILNEDFLPRLFKSEK